MNVLIAIDSFKGSITSQKAAGAIRRGILSADETARVTAIPVADGGEGTVATLVEGLGGELIEISVTGPLGTPVRAKYGWLPEQQTAVFEMAQAAGLPLVPKHLRDPMNTTTYGVGELLGDALDRGYRRFVLGIGGSATNDCGLGMLTALGCRFLDMDGKAVNIFGADVEKVAAIDPSGLDPRLGGCEILAACDVTNPLCGPNGASYVFAPQKGASPEVVARMDAAHGKFARLVRDTLGTDSAAFPGAGAAGGLGFSLKAFLGAEMRPGVCLILDTLNFDAAVRRADLIITGEGRLDRQSAMGKLPCGVARYAKRYGKPVVALCGCAGDGAEACSGEGIDAYFPIPAGPCTPEEAMAEETAAKNLERTAGQVYRLFRAAARSLPVPASVFRSRPDEC